MQQLHIFYCCSCFHSVFSCLLSQSYACSGICLTSPLLNVTPRFLTILLITSSHSATFDLDMNSKTLWLKETLKFSLIQHSLSSQDYMQPSCLDKEYTLRNFRICRSSNFLCLHILTLFKNVLGITPIVLGCFDHLSSYFVSFSNIQDQYSGKNLR